MFTCNTCPWIAFNIGDFSRNFPENSTDKKRKPKISQLEVARSQVSHNGQAKKTSTKSQTPSCPPLSLSPIQMNPSKDGGVSLGKQEWDETWGSPPEKKRRKILADWDELPVSERTPSAVQGFVASYLEVQAGRTSKRKKRPDVHSWYITTRNDVSKHHACHFSRLSTPSLSLLLHF